MNGRSELHELSSSIPSCLDLHDSVSERLRLMEKERQQLLATSPYACKFEKAVQDAFDNNDQVYMHVDPLSIWATVWNCESWHEAAPALRTLRSGGWEIIRPKGERDLLFEKTGRGFVWKLKYIVRDGLEIDATLNFYVMQADEHDGLTCQRVKIGERKIERVEDVYEIICPS